eukprot:9428341-Lingulodinium_polyedra.AAC.1
MSAAAHAVAHVRTPTVAEGTAQITLQQTIAEPPFALRPPLRPQHNAHGGNSDHAKTSDR